MKTGLIITFTIAFIISLSAQDLPPGVPRCVNPDGTLSSINPMFTTPAYQKEAFRLVLSEANRVAKELQLPEKLPIEEADVVRRFIVPFGYAYEVKSIGNITTANYFYNVNAGNKFNGLTVANYDETCFDLKDRGKLPISQLNTNGAYQLATQWLAKLQMDIKKLDRECKLSINPSEFWNDLRTGEPIKSNFVPIYFISWVPTNYDLLLGGGATVELYLPDNKLIALTVYDPKYILREPVVFTNLAALFPGKALIVTNKPPPAGPKIIRSLGPS